MKVVTRGRPVRKAAPAKRAQPNAAKQTTTTRKPAAKPAAKVSRSQATYDINKAPTDYHKQFAKWLRDVCGYDPNYARSKSAAFLAGVSFATASRPVFMKSDFLAEWREETGQAKRGPKSPTEKNRRSNRAVVSDDEFEDDSDEFEDEDSEDVDADEVDDDEFDDSDEDEESDEFDDDDDSEEDDDEFDDEEEEPEPPKRTRGAASRKAATTHGASGQRRTSAPSKKPTTRGKAKADEEDDEFVF